MEINLNDANFEQEILRSDVTCLVDFWAPWCGPCRMVAPTVKAIAEEYQGRLKVGKVNVDEAPQVAMRYGVMSIPTLFVFKNGERVNMVVGAKSKEEIVSVITPHL